MDKKHARQKAEERVNELKEFYRHLAIYTVVNSILLIINLVNSPDYLWFYWPLLGWGIGLISHAFKVSESTPPYHYLQHKRINIKSTGSPVL